MRRRTAIPIAFRQRGRVEAELVIKSDDAVNVYRRDTQVSGDFQHGGAR